MIHIVRKEAALWYQERAETITGAMAVHFREMARKVQAGLADHRLSSLRAEQKDYDLGRFGPRCGMHCPYDESTLRANGGDGGGMICPCCWTIFYD